LIDICGILLLLVQVYGTTDIKPHRRSGLATLPSVGAVT